MTDGGANISTSLTDKLRVGAQMYFYNVGELGKWQPQLDWAYVDYKFSKYFGVRAGKVKTALGLSNDTQDMSFLYTWALMPQSIYPWDQRSQTIAHTGLDLYGNIGLHRAGSLDYTLYAGLGSIDPNGGRYYSASAQGAMTAANLRTAGGDLRWNTPINGLTLGTSVSLNKQRNTVMLIAGSLGPGSPALPLNSRVDPERIVAAYADYSRGKWHFSAEGRTDHLVFLSKGAVFGPYETATDVSSTQWYVTAAYRISKRLEVGTYRSQYDCPPTPHDVPTAPGPLDQNSKHTNDQTVTARIDLTRFWNVKLEGHFIQGYGNVYAARGFYTADNPTLKPNTNMLIVRTGWNF